MSTPEHVASDPIFAERTRYYAHGAGPSQWLLVVVSFMSIETFIWTDHALLRLSQRRLERLDVEEAIRASHDERKANDGQADWLVQAMTPTWGPDRSNLRSPGGQRRSDGTNRVGVACGVLMRLLER